MRMPTSAYIGRASICRTERRRLREGERGGEGEKERERDREET